MRVMYVYICIYTYIYTHSAIYMYIYRNLTELLHLARDPLWPDPLSAT